jgi:hypothetical protein
LQTGIARFLEHSLKPEVVIESDFDHQLGTFELL